MKIQRIPWLMLAITAVLIMMYAPAITLLASSWWGDENYSHGLLVPPVIALMLWMGRDALRRESVRPARILGGIVVLLAILLLAIGIRGPIHFAQQVSLGLMLVGVTLYAGGFGFLRLLVAPLALLALAIPLPTVVLNNIAAPLQLFASQCAVWGMQSFDIALVREGNVIEMLPRGALKPHKLEVVQACSGIRSLMSLVTMGFMLAYFTYPRGGSKKGSSPQRKWWAQYGFWRSVVLVGLAIPIAVLTNAVRVSGTGILSHYYGIEVAEGFFHTFSGAMTYGVAAILLLAVGWLLDQAYRRTARRASPLQASKVNRPAQASEPA